MHRRRPARESGGRRRSRRVAKRIETAPTSLPVVVVRSVSVVVLALVSSLALSSASCAGGTRTSKTTLQRADAGIASRKESGAPEALPLWSWNDLSTRALSEAPKMHEVARVEQPMGSPVEVRSSHEACFRAFFTASAVAEAIFIDDSGAKRGEAATGAIGAVPPQGPVCTLRGERLRLVVSTLSSGGPSAGAPAIRVFVVGTP